MAFLSDPVVDLSEHRQAQRDAAVVRGAIDYFRGITDNPCLDYEQCERDGWQAGWQNARLLELLGITPST